MKRPPFSFRIFLAPVVGAFLKARVSKMIGEVFEKKPSLCETLDVTQESSKTSASPKTSATSDRGSLQYGRFVSRLSASKSDLGRSFETCCACLKV